MIVIIPLPTTIMITSIPNYILMIRPRSLKRTAQDHQLIGMNLFLRIPLSEDTCLYKRIFMDYTYGIGKIYTADEIEKAKQSPSFERKYNLKYLGKIGNVFHTKDIEAAIEKGRNYNPASK